MSWRLPKTRRVPDLATAHVSKDRRRLRPRPQTTPAQLPRSTSMPLASRLHSTAIADGISELVSELKSGRLLPSSRLAVAFALFAIVVVVEIPVVSSAPRLGIPLLAITVVALALEFFGPERRAKRLERKARRLGRSGDVAEAIRLLSLAERLHPLPTIRIQLATAYAACGMRQQAIRILAGLLARSFDQDTATRLASEYFAEPHSESEIEKTPRRRGSKPSQWQLQSICLVGLTFAREGRHELAVHALRAAARVPGVRERELKEVLYHLAVSHAALGNHDSARLLYGRVLAFDPAYLDTAEKLHTLERGARARRRYRRETLG